MAAMCVGKYGSFFDGVLLRRLCLTKDCFLGLLCLRGGFIFIVAVVIYSA